MVLKLMILGFQDHNNISSSISVHRPSERPSGGLIICLYTTQGGMTATHKVIFILSFMWMMNWGVRVTNSIISALTS